MFTTAAALQISFAFLSQNVFSYNLTEMCDSAKAVKGHMQLNFFYSAQVVKIRLLNGNICFTKISLSSIEAVWFVLPLCNTLVTVTRQE